MGRGRTGHTQALGRREHFDARSNSRPLVVGVGSLVCPMKRDCRRRAYLHHWMRPRRKKKCDSHPSFSQTDGDRVTLFLSSLIRSQRGFASGIIRSSIVRSQPQGHRNPTHQSSSSSRATTMLRAGRFAGRQSPRTTCNRRAGKKRSREHMRLRNQRASAFTTSSRRAACAAQAAPRAVPCVHVRGRGWVAFRRQPLASYPARLLLS